jgi:Kef-type K+ transport system membrane component KefB
VLRSSPRASRLSDRASASSSAASRNGTAPQTPAAVSTPGHVTPADTPSATALLARLALALGVIGALATLCGSLFRCIGQPPVVGEIVAGLVLGPSVVGWLAPSLFDAIFPPQVLQYLDLCAQAGLAIFMFSVGSEFDLRIRRRERTAIGAAGVAVMIVPFALGVLVAVPLYPSFAGGDTTMTSFAFFVGTALSVTAFPVLARIVHDSGLRGTPLGTLAMSLAAVADVLAWCALTVVLAMTHSQSPAGAVWALVLTVALCAVFLLGVRPLLRALTIRYANAALPDTARVSLVLVLVLGLAAATDWIGVHAIFGAFLAGLTLPRGTPLLGETAERVGAVNRAVLVPVFFASIGLQTDLLAAVAHPLASAAAVLLLLVAIVGKLGSAVPVAWLSGLPLRSALGLGVLMNARGVTEIVVLSTGLAAGVINNAAFTVLVIIALVTTVIVAPALRLIGVPSQIEGSATPAP